MIDRLCVSFIGGSFMKGSGSSKVIVLTFIWVGLCVWVMKSGLFKFKLFMCVIGEMGRGVFHVGWFVKLIECLCRL